MAKRFKRERFTVFKNRLAEEKSDRFMGMVKAKLDGDLTLVDGVFYLDGKEVFRAAEGTRREWQMWHQFYVELDTSPYSLDRNIAVFHRSKKNWGGGGMKYRDTVRRSPYRCGTGSAERNRRWPK